MKYIRLYEERLKDFEILTAEPDVIGKELLSEIKKGDYDLGYIKELLEWGHFDVNKLIGDDYSDGDTKETLLMAATYSNKPDIVRLLLDEGSDPNIQDTLGYTALLLASDKGFLEPFEELLKHPNIDLSITDNQVEYTALMRASMKGHLPMVQALLKHPNCNPNDSNSYGDTALLKAAWKGRSKEASELLKHPDCDPNLQDLVGYSPLMLAVIRGYRSIIEDLLNHPNIKKGIRTKDYKTAWDISTTQIRKEFPELKP